MLPSFDIANNFKNFRNLFWLQPPKKIMNLMELIMLELT